MKARIINQILRRAIKALEETSYKQCTCLAVEETTLEAYRVMQISRQKYPTKVNREVAYEHLCETLQLLSLWVRTLEMSSEELAEVLSIAGRVNEMPSPINKQVKGFSK